MTEDERPGRGDATEHRLRQARRAARMALAVEALWPTVFRLLCLAALFLILAWFGIFDRLGLFRFALLALFLGGLGWIGWRARGLRWPDRAAAEARIEAANGLAHRPIRSQSDRARSEDPFAAALWREHQRRLAARLGELRAGRPETRTERLDPYGLRAVLALLLVTAFAYAMGSGGGRIADALTAPPLPVQIAARVDAWVTPPGYTGRPPLYLTGQNAGSGTIEVPAGSVLFVRVSDGSEAALSFTPEGGAPRPVAPGTGEAAKSAGAATEGTPAAPPAGAFELPLRESGAAKLATTFSTLGDWRFAVIPDKAPTIAFAGEPMRGRNGALNLTYKATDDYGIVDAEALAALRDPQAPTAHPLFGPPGFKLALPRRGQGEATARSSTDLIENPYAGATVTLTLQAKDDAGQTAFSEPKTIVLPERAFRNPLARAVIEQRRILALDANMAPKVVEMLDAVTLRGEDYGVAARDQVALQAVRSRIANAGGKDEILVSAVDFLWRIALGIEDGNLSEAEKRLKDAQDALSEALKNGASDEEIDKLMAELRQAMQQYMQQLAEEMKNRPPLNQQQLQSGNVQEIRPQDLDRMMDRIENLAKSGSKDAAQQLLAEMQQMLENLQAARPMEGGQQQSGQNPMQQQMDKLGEMLRRQQELKNRTFDLGRRQMQNQEGMEGEMPPGTENQRSQQQGQPGGEQPMSPEELQRQLGELQKQQGQLQKDLQALQEALKEQGLQPGEGFGEAGKAMGQAEGALGQGDDGEAVDRQGQAMEALRRGARDMMQQMQQAMGQGENPGQGQGEGRQGQMNGGYGRGEQRSDRDPLGRPRSTNGPDFGQDTQVPDEIDTQRARQILDAIRQRLGDRLSPQMERDYLERLLKTP
ncbi:TIGR02302 family protein [Aureimonas endophytica]|uniref:TIGR02302 family protein n=1 Tax=Aureimonas endophytica TaxID=2027858 RepID=A0A917E8A5_9HYPH|nr:TIGR02302 family protein [Aureimonas endophytica]GGE13961.1 TIGR02302 family protein [Aureimonas endophytica]